MFQRLPIPLTQVKAGTTFKNLLTVIPQIIYSLYRVNEITKNVYNSIMNSIQILCKMDKNLCVLKIVTLSIPMDYYLIFQIK